MNMQEPSGEYLRRAPIRVRRVSKDEADQNRHGSSAFRSFTYSYKNTRARDRFLLVAVSYARSRKYKNFNELILECVNKKKIIFIALYMHMGTISKFLI